MPDHTSLDLPASTAKIDFAKTIDPTTLKDQSILVTGGTSGIGEAFTKALAEAGAYVTVIDVSTAQSQAVASQQPEKGFRVQFVQGDVRVWEDQIRAFEAAVANSPHKSLDIVIAVAGVSGSNILQWLDNPISKDGKLLPPDSKTIDINLTAVWYTTHLALHYFRQSLKCENRAVKSKQIVFVSSLAGYSSNEFVTDYVASKWGVRGLWRSIRAQSSVLGQDTQTQFRTSLIAPWFVKTPMTKVIVPYMDKIGLPFASLDDCVDGMMRIVCDEEVKGRAICIAPAGPFDLRDDFEGMDAGREWPERLATGDFGSSFEQLKSFWSGRQKSRGFAPQSEEQ